MALWSPSSLISEVSVVFQESLALQPDPDEFCVAFGEAAISGREFPLQDLNFPLFFVKFPLEFGVAGAAALHFAPTVRLHGVLQGK